MAKASESRDELTGVDQSEDRAARLRHMQPIINACTAITFLLFLFGVHALLVFLNARLAALDRSAIFTFLPGSANWWGFPVVGAISLCWEITLQIWSLLGHRATASEYREWGKTAPLIFRGHLFVLNGQKFFQWAAMFIALPVGIYTLLDLNEHTSFNPESMSVCGLAYRQWETRTYQDLDRITMVQGKVNSKGKYSQAPALVLDFARRYRWSSARWNSPKPADLTTLANFLAKKTNLPIEAALTEEGIPPSMPR